MRRSSSVLFILGSVLIGVMVSGCRPPVVVNPLPDVVAAQGEPSRDIDVSMVFADPDPMDQGRLTLAVVENTNPNVVMATLTGTTLTLVFLNSGSAAITIRATDPRGGFADNTFTVTVLPPSPPPALPPSLATPEPQADVIGVFIADLQLQATGCDPSCAFSVSGLPPNLQVDALSGRISGGLAYTAFTQGPDYLVTATTTNTSTNLTSPAVSFIWRALQWELDGGGEDGGDNGGGGDDGGAGGDAGDGGDLSPIAGAICRFVDMNGVTFRDNAGNEIQDEADADGQFFLTIPHDRNNPGFLQALKGFIECHPPDRTNLVVSTYLDTTGLRRGERLKGLRVDPATSVSRQIFEKLFVTDRQADLVAIHARLLADVSGLRTLSPSPRDNTLPADVDCCSDPETGAPCMVAVKDMDIPLDEPPGTSKESGRRGGMAAYIASQLFLAALKGEELDLGEPIPLPPPDDDDEFPDCRVPLDEQTTENFRTVLGTYLRTRTVVASDLVQLGLPPDEGIPRTTTESCG